MKIKFLSSLLLLSVSTFFGMHFMLHENETGEIERTGEEKARLAEEYFKFRQAQRSDEKGNFEFSDYMRAMKQADAITKNGTRASIAWEDMGPNNVGGRTRGLIVDNKNPNNLYTGSITGGIYFSKDGGLSWKNYFNQDNLLKVFSIGSMAQAVNGDIYVGTGNSSENGGTGTESSGGLGNGIYKKAANSDSFVLLTSTFNPAGFTTSNAFAFVNKLAPDPKDEKVVYAATGSGIKVTKDGGLTWTPVGGALSTGVVYTVRINSEGTVLYAGKDGRVYKSEDKGNSWTNIATSFGIGNRVEITVCDSFPSYVYALVTSGGNLKHIIRSVDNGVNWTQIGYSDPITQITFDPFCQNVANNKVCQGWYDIAFEVHPKDKDKLYLGGAARFYTWSPSNGWLQAARGGDFTGTDDFIHADMHHITFDPFNPNTMYVMCDGGIFKTNDAVKGFPYPKFLPKNRNYNVTQFYVFDVTLKGQFLGGTQDNGTNFVSYKESSPKTAREVSGGDGFACAISRVNPNYQFYTVYNGRYYRSVTNGESASSIVGSKIDGFNGAPGDGNADNVPFNTSIYLLEHKHPIQSIKATLNSTYIGTSQSQDGNSRYMLYVCSNPLTSGKLLWFRNISIKSYGYCYGSSYNANTLYIGRAGGGVSRLTGWNNTKITYLPDGTEDSLLGVTVDDYTIPGANTVWGIGVNDRNENHLIAATGGFTGAAKIYESRDGGKTWNSKQGNLPIMPSYDAVIDAIDSNKVYVATEFGAWATDNINTVSPIWYEINDGMGRVPIFEMKQANLFEDGCPVLYVGTHGRGFFRTVSNTPSACKTDVTIQTSINNIITNNMVKLFPNPSSDNVNVRFDGNVPSDAFIAIYNTNGQLVKKEKIYIHEGINDVSVDISSINKGNYFLRIENKEKSLGGAKLLIN